MARSYAELDRQRRDRAGPGGRGALRRAGRPGRQRAAGDHGPGRALRPGPVPGGAGRGDPDHRGRGPGDRPDPAGPLPVRGRARRPRQPGPAGAAVRGRAGRRAAGQRPGRAGRPARPGPGHQVAQGGPEGLRLQRPEVLLHRRDLGPLDRGQRAGRRRPPGPGLRRAGRPGRPGRRRLGRDGPAGHGQRLRGLRPGAGGPGLVIPYGGAFEVPQQLGARAQLVHAAIQVGIAGGALRDAGEFVRTRARPFFEATRAGWADVGRGRPAHDPPFRPPRHPGARGRVPARRRPPPPWRR